LIEVFFFSCFVALYEFAQKKCHIPSPFGSKSQKSNNFHFDVGDGLLDPKPVLLIY